MSQMISLKDYSDEELEELYQIIKSDIDLKFGSVSAKTHYRISIGIDSVCRYSGYTNSFNELGIPPLDEISRILEILKSTSIYDQKFIGPYKDHFVTLILSLDIKQVPLYINASLSRVRLTAQWRLRKGK